MTGFGVSVAQTNKYKIVGTYIFLAFRLLVGFWFSDVLSMDSFFLSVGINVLVMHAPYHSACQPSVTFDHPERLSLTLNNT